MESRAAGFSIGRLAKLLLAAPALWAQSPNAAHFHHIHLNSVNPAAAIAFYTSRFDCEKRQLAGVDAVWAQKSWFLFHRVDAPPPSAIVSAIWHFGWGAEDMNEEYLRQLDLGTKFDTPITDISGLAHYAGFYFAYVAGPDRALIELNTAAYHRFGHLHLLSADPTAAADWYTRHFGVRRLLQGGAPSHRVRFYRGAQVGPSESLMMDNVNIIIFPVEYARTAMAKDWDGRAGFESTRGRVVDHIAFSVANLQAALDVLKRDGVKPLGPVAAWAGGAKRVFFEGPDRIAIELVEAPAPPLE